MTKKYSHWLHDRGDNYLDARRNHQSVIGEQALEFFRRLYDVERDAKDMTPDDRRRLRKQQASCRPYMPTKG